MNSINNISFEDWACACANLSAGMPIEEVINILGTEVSTWENTNAQWATQLATLISQDPSIAAKYGACLANPKQGKFGDVNNKKDTQETSIKEIPDFNTYQDVYFKLHENTDESLENTDILQSYSWNQKYWEEIENHYSQSINDLVSRISIREAFMENNFIVVKEKIKNTPLEYKELSNFDKQNLVEKITRNKYFSIIFTIIDQNLEETDLNELGKLDGSFIESVLNAIPIPRPLSLIQQSNFNFKEKPDSEVSEFLEKFLDKIKNIGESVGNNSLLQWALTKKFPIPVIEMMIQKGCEINIYDASDNSLLHLNLPEPYINLLIEKGLDPNHKNKGNETPLQKAIRNNAIESVSVLLENGADPHHKDNNGNSMFYVSLVEQVNFNIYDLLCEYDSPNFEEMNKEETTFLFNYIRMLNNYSGSAELEYLGKILEQGADIMQPCMYYGKETTPMDMAITKSIAIFEIVMNHFTGDVNETDNNGDTLLHKVCAFDVNYQADEALDLYKKAKLLLEMGANSSLRNIQDRSALDLAATDNLKEKTVKLLLNQ